MASGQATWRWTLAVKTIRAIRGDHPVSGRREIPEIAPASSQGRSSAQEPTAAGQKFGQSTAFRLGQKNTPAGTAKVAPLQRLKSLCPTVPDVGSGTVGQWLESQAPAVPLSQSLGSGTL